MTISIDEAISIARSTLKEHNYKEYPIISASIVTFAEGNPKWVVSFLIDPRDCPGSVEVLVDPESKEAEIPECW